MPNRSAKRHSRPVVFLSFFLVLFLPPSVFADTAVDYTRDIKPILARKCSACHGPLKQRAGLRLDTAKLMRQGGDSGPALVPEHADKSLLMAAVTGTAGFRMPPEGKPLDEKEIALLKAWIDQGAKAPADETALATWREHWSYQPPLRPAVPEVKNSAWVKNPIDAFIAAARERRNLQPSAPADRALLLRRVYLDLIGLPPTRAELHAFLKDESADAYEKVVDRLLNSPRYGERWGRHWMDVWRYSDWYGRRGQGEIRYSQFHIWRWRDWIIESVNADKGYDRMIVEMLAGDELAPDDPKILAATGFIGRNWYKFDRDVWMRETVEHTATGFLGLTMKCARCHDHKYDPISQIDYYRFRAFFEPHDVRLDPISGETDLKKDGLPRAFDARHDAPTYLFLRGDDRYPDKDNPLAPGVPSALGKMKPRIEAVNLPVEAWYPALRPQVAADMLQRAEMKVNSAKDELEKANREKAQEAALKEKKLAVAQAELTALQARIEAERAKYAAEDSHRSPTRKRGNAESLAHAASDAECRAKLAQAEFALLETEHALQQLQAAAKKNEQAIAATEKTLASARKTLESAQSAMQQKSTAYSPLGQTYPKTSTGRRLALARWITDADNPRTARVAVNHMWKRHFGTALVPTVANFGLAGKEPTHRELLDWLAVELVENGWSMKHLHRLMVTSNTYRLASADSSENLKRDPDNKYLWRMNSKRMEAEVVRDSLLHAAGHLDTAMGGPELPQDQGQTSRRRSVYFRLTPDDKMEMLELFDLANPNECYERTESVVPQQSLALMNSPIALTNARLLARELSKQTATDAAFVQAAFEQVLGRAPAAAEQQRCEQFLQQQTRLLKEPAKLTPFDGNNPAPLPPATDAALRARENLVHVLFNHNDFVTVR